MLNKKYLLTFLQFLVSVILIAVILDFVGLEEVIKEFSNIDLFYLFLAIVFLILTYLGMVFRIQILLKETGVSARFSDLFKSHLVGMLIADFTPSRSGYLTTAAVMHYKYNIPGEKAMVSIVGPQVFDFALKVVVGTLAMYYLVIHFFNINNSAILFMGSISMLVLIAVMVLILFSEKFLKLFSFTLRFPFLSPVYSLFLRMQKHSHVVVRKTPEILALLLFTWSMKAISWYFVAKSLGITIDLGQVHELVFYYFSQPLITMLEFVPSPTLAGLGLSEGGATVIFTLFGISAAKAASFALLARFKTTAINLISIPDALDTMKNSLKANQAGMQK